jgi:hypothetical protein
LNETELKRSETMMTYTTLCNAAVAALLLTMPLAAGPARADAGFAALKPCVGGVGIICNHGGYGIKTA